MADNGLIPGLKINSPDTLFCENCQYGKLHRKPFKKKTQERALKLSEYVYMDLCGKMTHPSTGDSNYFLLLKNDSISYRSVYFIKHKSDAFAKFAEYKKLVETQTTNKIKKVHSDNGLKFSNKQFRQFFKDNGIIHEFSAPYTAEQNGRIERENRSIVENARTMLITANLQPENWAEAINTSVYILNRKPRSMDKKIPYELWTRKAVDLRHLRKFGADVYVHIPKQFRTKFSSKAKKMVLVEYENDSTNYHVLDITIGKITITRDVSFNESVHSEEDNNKKIDNTFSVYFNNKRAEPENEELEQEDEPENEVFEDAVAGQDNEDIQVTQKRRLRDRSKLCRLSRYDEECYIACLAVTIDEPQTFEEAIVGDNAEKWKQAMTEEIESLRANNKWTLEELPENRQAIGIQVDISSQEEHRLIC